MGLKVGDYILFKDSDDDNPFKEDYPYSYLEIPVRIVCLDYPIGEIIYKDTLYKVDLSISNFEVIKINYSRDESLAASTKNFYLINKNSYYSVIPKNNDVQFFDDNSKISSYEDAVRHLVELEVSIKNIKLSISLR